MGRLSLPMRKHGADAVYARLPKMECKRLCQDCCGPIFMSEAEGRRIERKIGHAPKLPDCIEKQKGLDGDLTCTLLDRQSGNCTVYNLQPLICRVWGMTPALRCPHGCEPERWLTDAEVHAMLIELDRL